MLAPLSALQPFHSIEPLWFIPMTFFKMIVYQAAPPRHPATDIQRQQYKNFKHPMQPQQFYPSRSLANSVTPYLLEL
jgi:hypothetical protein